MKTEDADEEEKGKREGKRFTVLPSGLLSSQQAGVVAPGRRLPRDDLGWATSFCSVIDLDGLV